jgi:hypothetical protein
VNPSLASSNNLEAAVRRTIAKSCWTKAEVGLLSPRQACMQRGQWGQWRFHCLQPLIAHSK